MPMTMKDQKKLMAAGFRIFRKTDMPNNYRIREARGAGAWALHSKHKNSASLNRAWNDLMKDPKCIGG